LVELSLLNGALERGELAELWASEESSGATLVMVEMLHALTLQGQCLALVDGSDSFDPENIAPAVLERLLWVRATTAGQAIKATDMLLRDGNLPLVLLQLRGLPLNALRRIPNQNWYRLQQLSRQSGTSCLVITPHPLVPCARKRWQTSSHFTLDDLEREAVEIHPRLHVEMQWRGDSTQTPAVKAG
jgi:hypothetical protein